MSSRWQEGDHSNEDAATTFHCPGIEAVRARCGVGKPVLIFHTDLPSNDFTSLFRVLDDDPNSYLSGSPGVYSAAVGRSFLGTILPPGQVHLGWNSWAVHWLSHKSVDAPDHVTPTLSAVPAVRTAASTQSRATGVASCSQGRRSCGTAASCCA
jgi:S-adenosylmethionine-dependent carboxyl methyltransferase